MLMGLTEKYDGIISSDQLEEIDEYICFIQSLSSTEKLEFRGIMRGMQVMKDMQSDAQCEKKQPGGITGNPSDLLGEPLAAVALVQQKRATPIPCEIGATT